MICLVRRLNPSIQRLLTKALDNVIEFDAFAR